MLVLSRHKVALVLSVLAASWVWQPFLSRAADVVTVYVVRHADRPPQDRLTVTGLRRAQELAYALRAEPLDAVYSTQTVRTMQTAAPAALASGVEITPYGGSGWMPAQWKTFIDTLRSGEAGSRILIVGHSNTVPELLELLGVQKRSAEAYGDLFEIRIEDGRALLNVRRVEVLERAGEVEFQGVVSAPTDVSAIASTKDGSLLLLGSDEVDEDSETNAVDVLRRIDDTDSYELLHSIELPVKDAGDEIDIEAITRHGDASVFYVVGSHSYRRKSVANATRAYRDNLSRFVEESPDRERSRDRLFRIEIDAVTGALAKPIREVVGLRKRLGRDPVLEHFEKIPSKENGIDIEALASDGERLFVGFRGPVLRHGLTPVLVLDPERPLSGELRYVSLEGRGLRDMSAVEGGFLVLAGPVGEPSLSSAVYFWDGQTCMPGTRQPTDPPLGTTTRIGSISAPVGSAAEGLLVLAEQPEAFEVLVVYDGAAGGEPTKWHIPKPHRAN